jgi:hypothetical protein
MSPRNLTILVFGLVVGAVALAFFGSLGERVGRVTPDEVASAPVKAIAGERSRRSIGKPRPPVEVLLAPGAQLESGVPGQLTLRVRTPLGIEGIDLAVEGDEGLAVISATGEVPGTGGTWYQSDGEAARFEISATPMSGGTRYVSGLLSFTVNGVPQAVPFRVPVEVGGPVTVPAVPLRKPDREPVKDATGELVDSMSAETMVR